MKSANTTFASFKSSSFNTTEDKDSFVNPGCFGDDVCEFFIKELKNSPLQCSPEPIAEDWGWEFAFKFGEKQYFVGCAFNTDYECWLIFIERMKGFKEILTSIFAKQEDAVPLEVAQALHKALIESDKITNLKWHKKDDWDTDLSNESKGLTQNIGSHEPL